MMNESTIALLGSMNGSHSSKKMKTLKKKP